MGALGQAERHMARGALSLAREALLPELDASGDKAAALAARLLRAQADAAGSPTPDAMAAALDRLVCLVDEQERQLRALQDLVEAQL